MSEFETEQDARQERIASALERIATSADNTERIEALEELLTSFVLLMQNPQATDEDWTTLLDEAKDALNES